MLRSTSVVSLCLASMTAIASAQPASGAPATGTTAPATEPAAAAAPVAPTLIEPPSGPTLRNGFSLSVGQEFGTSNLMNKFSGQLYGVDWRIGAQINKAFGVYADTHLSFGSVSQNSQASGITGNFATAINGEYILPIRLFVGAGAGYGVLNNPSGPLVQFRIGYYPFEHTGPDKARRLNIALDTRLYFVSAGNESVTMKHIALTLGYDRF